jgi:hypothetical protein
MLDLGPTSEATQSDYQRIAAALEPKGGVASQMFGMPTLKVGGKGFAGIFGDAMVFKLGGPAHTTALGLAGAMLFDPSGLGRPMKEWVVVPRAHADRWPALAADAMAYLGASLAAGAPAAKKAAPRKSAIKNTAAKKSAAKKSVARKTRKKR